MYWNISVISLCLLLLLFITWKEVKRHDKSWLVARIIVSSIAVISLACMAMSFKLNREQQRGNTIPIILSEGFNKDSVQRLLDVNKDSKIFTTNKAIKAFDAGYITGAIPFTELSDNSKAVHVFGYGLDENDVSLLANTPVIFHPTLIKNYITDIGWTQKIVSGEPLVVQGTFINAASSPVTILLSGFKTNLDSVTMPAKQTSNFQVTAIPKQVGKAVYSLVVLSGKDTLENEPIPVEVDTATPLSVLLLAASPDFENKFLRNWLTKNEYKFAVRTAISRNKYDKEYVNISSVYLDHITPSLLEKFDIIIADAAELSVLPVSEVTTIRNYVESKGIGLIVKTDSALSSSAFYSKMFPFVKTKDSIEHLIRLNLGNSGYTTNALKLQLPLYITNTAGTQPLVSDQQMRTMANSKLYGEGKLIVTTIGNTYTWQLSGDTKDYAYYWSHILQKAAKRIPLQEEWAVNPELPQKDEEVNLQLETTNTSIPTAQSGKDIIYMKQNYLLPYQWNATYWPVDTGWQTISSDHGSTYYWYVYADNNWKRIKAAHKINVTNKYVSGHNQKQIETPGVLLTKEEFPKIYFFIIFICCMGFLWAEAKFRSDSGA